MPQREQPSTVGARCNGRLEWLFVPGARPCGHTVARVPSYDRGCASAYYRGELSCASGPYGYTG
jgi:hypothetical protein